MTLDKARQVLDLLQQTPDNRDLMEWVLEAIEEKLQREAGAWRTPLEALGERERRMLAVVARDWLRWLPESSPEGRKMVHHVMASDEGIRWTWSSPSADPPSCMAQIAYWARAAWGLILKERTKYWASTLRVADWRVRDKGPRFKPIPATRETCQPGRILLVGDPADKRRAHCGHHGTVIVGICEDGVICVGGNQDGTYPGPNFPAGGGPGVSMSLYPWPDQAKPERYRPMFIVPVFSESCDPELKDELDGPELERLVGELHEWVDRFREAL